MATADLNKENIQAYAAKDSIVIVNALTDLPGGRSLDVSGVASGTTVLHAGHIIIQKTATGDYLPLGVNNGAYASLPTGHTYAGVLKASVLVSDPRAAIVTSGQINAAASPYPVTSDIKEGLPLIQFLY